MDSLRVEKTGNDGADELLAQLGLLRADSHGLPVRLAEETALQGLAVTRTKSEVTIRYSRQAYLCRALGILKEREKEETFTVTETAHFSTSGVMVDCSRNAVPHTEFLRRLIRLLALMGHTMLMLYTEDTYEIPGEPYFGYMRGRYSQQELAETVAYAARFGMEVIPCIQTLAHLNAALRWSPYAALKDNSDILLADYEPTYALIEKMIASCRAAYTSKRIHVGMDEAWMLGRGAYLDKFGHSDKAVIMRNHLARVTEICSRHGFTPMLWGDMFFRAANGGEYYGNTVQAENSVPAGTDLVYWDYYATREEDYAERIRAHKATGGNVLFAAGAWKWTGFVPCLSHSLRVSPLAYRACLDNGVKEVFTTAWGDNGCEAALLSVLPLFMQLAEFTFTGEEKGDLPQRFAACTGGNWEDFLMLEAALSPAEYNPYQNPCKYLLYQDVLTGMFDWHIADGYAPYYEKTALRLREAAGRNKEYDYLFLNLASLCGLLSVKCDVGKRLHVAYTERNNAELEHLARAVLPLVLEKGNVFLASLQAQWMQENKPFGFEVLDIWVGGMLQRVRTAIFRLKQYLAGDIPGLPELEAERLPFDGRETAETGCFLYRHIASAGEM